MMVTNLLIWISCCFISLSVFTVVSLPHENMRNFFLRMNFENVISSDLENMVNNMNNNSYAEVYLRLETRGKPNDTLVAIRDTKKNKKYVLRVRNPLVIPFHNWQDYNDTLAQILITKTGESKPLRSYWKFQIKLPSQRTSSSKRYSANKQIFEQIGSAEKDILGGVINFNINVTCNENWIGATCDRFCDRSESLRQNYTCDEMTGMKFCPAGSQCQIDDCVNSKCTKGHRCESHISGVKSKCECYDYTLCDDHEPTPTTFSLHVNHTETSDHRNDPCSLGNPCHGRGKCRRDDNSTLGFQCICVPGYEGDMCERVSPLCGPRRCVHGYCVRNSGEEPFCKCFQGFVGESCDLQMSSCHTQNPCQHNGTCVEIRTGPVASATSSLYFHCQCPQHYTGLLCEHHTECTPGLCLNGGVCQVVFDSQNPSRSAREQPFMCHCPLGYSGSRCEVNLFLENPCSFCVNATTASCAPDIQQYGSHCLCKPGFHGLYCEVKNSMCSEGSNPCHSLAQCQTTSQSPYYKCICPEGRFGNHCERKPLCKFNNFCRNGGTCLDLDTNSESAKKKMSTYICECPVGFHGKHCELPLSLCETQLCLNRGSCLPMANSSRKTCVCPAGFSGERCEITNPCARDHCQNGGSCFTSFKNSDDIFCRCPSNFTGDRCEVSQGKSFNEMSLILKTLPWFLVMILIIGLIVTLMACRRAPKQLKQSKFTTSTSSELLPTNGSFAHYEDVDNLGVEDQPDERATKTLIYDKKPLMMKI